MSIRHHQTRLHQFDTVVYIGLTIFMKWEPVIMEFSLMIAEVWMAFSRNIFSIGWKP